MIFGLGTDISKVSRFQKWISNEGILNRFFSPKEIMERGTDTAKCEHYAARFSAKEAFSKALGTGISGFDLREVFVTNDENGRPVLNVTGKAEQILKKIAGDCVVHVSLSHEKEFAVAVVIIEKQV